MTDYAVVNPATGETLKEYPTIGDDELRAAIGRADAAHRGWSRSSTVQERADLIRRVGALHTEQRERLGEIIVREMGKPIEQAMGEVDFSAEIYEFYADNAESLLADEPIELAGGDGSAFVRRSSVGVLLGIMPWNYPYYQVARFAGPNLVIGNTILLKHAPQCPESAAASAPSARPCWAGDGMARRGPVATVSLLIQDGSVDLGVIDGATASIRENRELALPDDANDRFLDGPACRRLAVVDFDPQTGEPQPPPARFEPKREGGLDGTYPVDDDPDSPAALAVNAFGIAFERSGCSRGRMRWSPRDLGVRRRAITRRAASGEWANAVYDRTTRSLAFLWFTGVEGSACTRRSAATSSPTNAGTRCSTR